MSTVLRVNNVWKVFSPPGTSVDVEDPESLQAAESAGGVVAVRDVSLILEPGEFFVVMGLSGSGKSTFIRSLLRLVEPTAGEIFFDGQDVCSLNRRELTEFRREKASMVFQHYGLLPHRTVLENAAFGLKLKGTTKKERLERAEQALVRVGLGDWLNHYPAQLSGGMQQRVGIARALAKNPTLLLMDEPFSGLDPLIKREMQDEIIRLQEEWGCTVLFVTHDLDEAVRLGHRMSVMRAGEFVQVGRPEDILDNPADDYVAQFVDGARVRRSAEAVAGPAVVGATEPQGAARTGEPAVAAVRETGRTSPRGRAPLRSGLVRSAKAGVNRA